MLDFGFSEIAFIVLAALVLLGPKDMMEAARAARGWWRTLMGFREEARKQMTEFMDETGFNDTTTIIDLEGKEQVAYDISELEDMRDITPKDTPKKP